jgi:hypothetical protein
LHPESKAVQAQAPGRREAQKRFDVKALYWHVVVSELDVAIAIISRENRGQPQVN